MRRAARTAGLAALCLSAVSLALPGAAGAWPNPANHPKLLNAEMDEGAYDHAHRCVRKARPGTRLLERWLDRNVRGESWGMIRCERLSKTTRSLHSEGRALDWHLDVKNKRERRAANFLIQRLLEPDARGNPQALARRMGVQEVIYDCRSWFSGSEGLGPYSGCEGGRVDRTTAHRDHIHIGLSIRGANAKTSFWRKGIGRK